MFGKNYINLYSRGGDALTFSPTTPDPEFFIMQLNRVF